MSEYSAATHELAKRRPAQRAGRSAILDSARHRPDMDMQLWLPASLGGATCEYQNDPQSDLAHSPAASWLGVGKENEFV